MSEPLTLIYSLYERGTAQVILLEGSTAAAWRGVHTFDVESLDRELAALRRALSRTVRRGQQPEAVVAAARLVFDLLLPTPVKNRLRGGGDVLTVSSDVDVPWHVLHDGAQFLGLRWALGEVPLDEAPVPRPVAQSSDRLLVVADPAGDLPAARFEGEILMRHVASDGGQECDLRLGRLRQRDLLRIFKSFRMVHFAGHVDPASEDSPGGWRMADGHLDERALRALVGGPAPQFVFCNACSSSADAARSLEQILVDAGARHFIGTVVDLEDLAGAEFARRFYSVMLAGQSIGEALRSARMHAYDQGLWVWAAYRLRGSPETTYFRSRIGTSEARTVRTAVSLCIRVQIDSSLGTDGLVEERVRLQQRLREMMRAHGGRLLTGRGAVARAVFGMPRTYETDAVHALRAAEEVSREWPDAVTVLGAGPAVSVGPDMVSASAYAAESAVWMLEPGVYGLTDVCDLLSRSARVSASGVEGLHELRLLENSPRVASESSLFVGRGPELTRLRRITERVMYTSSPAAVGVFGAAGIGKTHFVERALAGSGFSVYRGMGEPLEYSAMLGPIVQIVRAIIGVPFHASPAIVEKALISYLETLDHEVEESMDSSIGGSVLTIDMLMDEPVERMRMMERIEPLTVLAGLRQPSTRELGDELGIAFREFIVSLGCLGPVAILFEDLHWFSPEALRITEEVVRHVDVAEALLIVTTRPGADPRVSRWFDVPGHQRIELQPLDETDAGILLQGWMKGSKPSETQAIIERAEGNPLFLRELARTRTTRKTTLPVTVEAVVQARLDSLPRVQRETLRAAAILGRSFWEAGIAALMGLTVIEPGTMNALEERGFVSPEASVLTGHRQWRFQQGLHYEVSYGSIGTRARKAWHGRAALWWSEEVHGRAVGDARGSEEPSCSPEGAHSREVARHFTGAGDHERAANAWLLAARQSEGKGDQAETRGRLESVLTALEHAPTALRASDQAWAEGRLAVLLEKLGGTLDRAGLLIKAALGRTSAEEVEERVDRIEHASRIFMHLGRADEAERVVSQGLVELAAMGVTEDSNWGRRLGFQCAYVKLRSGQYEEGIEEIEALRAGGNESDWRLLGRMRAALGFGYLRQADYPESLAHSTAALAIYEEHGDAYGQSNALNLQGLVHWYAGEYRDALDVFKRALGIIVRGGDRLRASLIYNNLAGVYGECGRFEKAAKFLREAIRIQDRAGERWMSSSYANLAAVLISLREYDEAEEWVDRALALVRDLGERNVEPRELPSCLAVAAELYVQQGRHEEALELAGEAQGFSRSLSGEAVRIHAQVMRVLGMAFIAMGEYADARASLDEAASALESVGTIRGKAAKELELVRAEQSKLPTGSSPAL